MTKLLHGLEKSIDTRFSLYRQMAARAGAPAAAPGANVDPEVRRAALKACVLCRQTCACQAWLNTGLPGVPLFCRGRTAFLDLAARRAAERADDDRVPLHDIAS